MSRLTSAVQAHIQATQKPLPQALTALLSQLNSDLVTENNGKLSFAPQQDIELTDPEDNKTVRVPLTMNLGLLASVRQMSEEEFTELVIACLVGDAEVSFQSYLKSNNHYISITSPVTENDESDDSSSSSTRRRGGRRGGNRA